MHNIGLGVCPRIPNERWQDFKFLVCLLLQSKLLHSDTNIVLQTNSQFISFYCRYSHRFPEILYLKERRKDEVAPRIQVQKDEFSLFRPQSCLDAQASPFPPSVVLLPFSNPPTQLLHPIQLPRNSTARALSFHSQVLNGVAPVQIAQNGLYCKAHPDFGGTACCFACGSTKPLSTLRKNPIKEIPQLHLADCIWRSSVLT